MAGVVLMVMSKCNKYRLAKYIPDPSADDNKAEDKDPGNLLAAIEGSSGMQISEALKLQMEVQKRLHEQLEVQRQLQLRIEAQGKYLKKIIEEQQRVIGAGTSRATSSEQLPETQRTNPPTPVPISESPVQGAPPSKNNGSQVEPTKSPSHDDPLPHGEPLTPDSSCQPGSPTRSPKHECAAKRQRGSDAGDDAGFADGEFQQRDRVVVAAGLRREAAAAMQASVAVSEALEAGRLVRLPAAALAVPLACLPFLSAHVAVLVVPAGVAAYPGQLAHASDVDAHCAYPAYAATLLLALAAVYAPLLASACWTIAAVAINRRMRGRAYALVALVVAPLPVQVVALALTSVWETPRRTSPTVGLVGFLAAGIAAAAALAILVLLPVYDALVLGEEKQLPVAAAGEEAHELGR
ncbi:hypothetical protein E2562_012490 [Oryza meyeriana var. granulata]|uniref:MYB-CC type transcription factor LHEQLE-containing domain-containing protein n=1 Tax=Oryza meyeriana var. granulata TaxID=110450 RepID=A0A6G1BWF3_9ORYZ|nr:hypothetical protein E2562_012490 [Oryza meyeriana var. granulata]